MNYKTVLNTVLLLCAMLFVLQGTSPNSRFRSGATTQLVERVVRLPTGNRCSLCQFNNVCFNRGDIAFSPDSRSVIAEHAQRRACELRNAEQPRFMEREIRFQPMREAHENDLLNPALLSLKDASKVKMMSHMPHYVELSLLSAIRSATLLEVANVTSLKPLLLTPKAVLQAQWFDGAHDAFRTAFNRTQVRTETDEACFRSVYVSKCHGVAPETVFFQQRLAAAMNGERAVSAPSATATHAIQVRILSRVGSRRILNVEQVTNAVRNAFGAELNRTRVHIKLLRFEKKRFHYQMQHMMNTHVLIASHGAGLTNVMFMARGGSVIEIVPFGMRKLGFRRQSRLAALHYEQIVAPADVQKVRNCARRKRLHQTFWRRWTRALAGEAVRVGTDTTQRSCLRRQELRVPEAALRAALQRVVKRYKYRRSGQRIRRLSKRRLGQRNAGMCERCG